MGDFGDERRSAFIGRGPTVVKRRRPRGSRAFAELERAAKPKHRIAMTNRNADSPPTLEGAILALCADAGPGRTIGPTDAAQAYAAARGEGPLAWPAYLSQVRAAAIRLAEAGRIVIYRKGKPADPHDFRGVYRLGAPRSD
jgi:hypothetical protein